MFCISCHLIELTRGYLLLIWLRIVHDCEVNNLRNLLILEN